jgi:hypothetical protein
MARCVAKTKSGSRCTKSAQSGRKVCGIHIGATKKKTVTRRGKKFHSSCNNREMMPEDESFYVTKAQRQRGFNLKGMGLAPTDVNTPPVVFHADTCNCQLMDQ